MHYSLCGKTRNKHLSTLIVGNNLRSSRVDLNQFIRSNIDKLIISISGVRFANHGQIGHPICLLANRT